jgi:hypothetical protein
MPFAIGIAIILRLFQTMALSSFNFSNNTAPFKIHRKTSRFFSL